MAADDPDGIGDYTEQSDAAAALLPMPALKIHLEHSTVADARARLLSALETGAVVANWFGHSGLDRLAAEGLLTAADVATLTNRDKAPIFSIMGCVAALFELPGFDSLGETLVMHDNGGAVAVWAPTQVSYPSSARVLNEFYFHHLFGGDVVTLGDAVRKAIESYSLTSHPMFMARTYVILGDPALRTD